MSKRQLPRWSDLRPLLRPRPFAADHVERRLSRAHTIADLRTLARRRVPRVWFRLYLWRDREAGRRLVARARAVGVDTLILTVDTPIAGARMRDVRNGLTIPPTLSLRTLAGMARHPAWWANLLTSGPLELPR